MSEPLRIAILGSTGSIGTQAIDVAKQHPDKVKVVALGAHSNVELITAQARELGVSELALSSGAAAQELGTLLPAASVRSGREGVAELAQLPEVDLVLNAVTGFAGLSVTLTAIRAGKKLGLANKESLVAGGDLVMPLVKPSQMIPVDSEHSAIFQCLLGEERAAFSKIWLTASGGPFRAKTAAQLQNVTVGDALAHPTWDMGAKITIDSATLMNKGLEVIEAKHLFDVSYDDIHVVVHPQSCIHSMVEFTDGSVKAHLGVTDMRIPIQFAFSYPHRWSPPAPPVDFTKIGSLDFEAPAYDRFPCLALAIEAGKAGGSVPAVLNAANEVAVAAFLKERCGFMDIPRIVEETMTGIDRVELESVEQLEEIDTEARAVAETLIQRM